MLGALPGLPKIAVHWPLIDFERGPETGADNFIEWWHKADRGELDPFLLVVEGSIPNETNKPEGYWCGIRHRPETGQPMPTSGGPTARRRKRARGPGRGTCSSYGGIHAMAGNPTGAMGLPDDLAGPGDRRPSLPIVCVPGCPIHPGTLPGDPSSTSSTGSRPRCPTSPSTRPSGRPGSSGTPFMRAAIGRVSSSRPTSPPSAGRPMPGQLGRWGPRVKCNVPKRGWMGGVGGCPNVGGICIAWTARLPRQPMPFMDEPPGV